MNYFKTGFLLVALTLLFVFIAGAFAGSQGAVIAFIFTLLMNFAAYWFSDKIILGMYAAKKISRDQAPQLFEILFELVNEANLPMPQLYIVENAAPNAFATGRDPRHAAICVTSGILSLLTREELKGVIAHELAHIKNRDTLIMTVAATIAGAIMMIANMLRWGAMFAGPGTRDRQRGGNLLGVLIVSILAPVAAMLVQLAISRTREYSADAKGAKFAHNPKGLASALGKLREAAKFHRLGASPQTAHLFIVNPLSGDFLANLFSTHPPVEERIKRLSQL